MDKNEVITLSSDDENDYGQQFEKKRKNSVNLKPTIITNSGKLFLTSAVKKIIYSKGGCIVKPSLSENKLNNEVPKKKFKGSNTGQEIPEVVDLVDCLEKSPNEFNQVSIVKINQALSEIKQNHSNTDIINIDATPQNNDSCETTLDETTEESSSVKEKVPTENLPVKCEVENITNECQNTISEPDKINNNIIIKGYQNKNDVAGDGSCQNLKFFTEFVEYCGSLEKIPNDRARLTKKLMKRYGEADSTYIKSKDFRNLIQKCKDKVNENNLYLIAKDITDELSYRKKFDISSVKSCPTDQNNQRDEIIVDEVKIVQHTNNKTKKRTKIINKIIKKLDKLGTKIREMEEQEVDLSDEEESAYVQLQRYRERFCQIYQKLCKFTNEIADADRIYNRKLCFTESKYPAINKCIETWLNKTKRFPDFTDIMKLLESQSGALGLPSNKESIRAIATEIFQHVGAMLQRRRKYDLWDSFCGFLDEKEDPAQSDPNLEKILQENYETRVKKEQEIFQHYVELQEKERLEPEEVPDEEANQSPMESGNEDEIEIEEIENCLNKRLDMAFKEKTTGNGNNVKNENANGLENETNCQRPIEKLKESKNNFKNCKSLKWRSEKVDKKRGSLNERENEKEKENKKVASVDPNKEWKKDDSDLELIAVEEDEILGKKEETVIKVKTEAVKLCKIPGKRALCSETENQIIKKKKSLNPWGNGTDCLDLFEVDDDNEGLVGKSNDVFDVRCCQIFSDNVFEDLAERKKDWGKRKVFRDLTNVNRLIELHGKNRKMSELFSPSFFHRSFHEFEKSSWKKRFKVTFRLVVPKDQKCAVNQEEKTGKSLSSDSGGDSDDKDIQNNGEGEGEDEGDNFFSGSGNGSQDNNEDKNKKNGRTGDDLSENKIEEEDEEEEEEDKGENQGEKPDFDSNEHSLSNQKTEEPSESNSENQTPLETINNPNENEAIETTETSEGSPSRSNDRRKSNDIETENPTETLEEDSEPQSTKAEVSNGQYAMEEDTMRNETEEISGEMENYDETQYEQQEPIYVEDEMMQDNEEREAGYCDVMDRDEFDDPDLKPFCDNLLRVETTIVENPLNEYVQKASHFLANINKQENGNKKVKPTRIEPRPGRASQAQKYFQVEPPGPKVRRKSTPSTSDEERVKRFLLHSPSSISITPPRKLTLSKPPSQSAMQALATLRNLKGISATIVKGKPKKEEDVVVIESSSRKHNTEQNHSNPVKRRRNEIPVISNVQSVDCTTPKIVTVQGNVSGFGNSWPEPRHNTQSGPSSIRISNVWGSMPNSVPQSSGAPGCSFRQSNPPRRNPVKKPNPKKPVEYVVLD